MAENGKSEKRIYRKRFRAGMGNVCGLFQPMPSYALGQATLLHDMGKVQHDFQAALRKHIECLSSEQRSQVKQMLLELSRKESNVPLYDSVQEIMSLEE